MRFHKIGGLVFNLLLIFATSVPADEATTEKLYYAIEQNGTVCGFSEVDVAYDVLNGKTIITMTESVMTSATAMGASVKTTFRFTYKIDAASGAYFYHESDIEQGTLKLGGTFTIVGESAQMFSLPDSTTDQIPLPPGVLLENTRLFLHLPREFPADGPQEKAYQVLSEIDGNIHDVVYTKTGTEKLELAGQKFDALVFDRFDRTVGIKMQMWINAENGFLLKSIMPLRTVYLADASVKDVIAEVDLDENIFVKANVSISDLKAITYMKVRAKLQPAGLWITPESLNIPGQSFTGTVEENLIDGVFEISHPRYDGTNAPPFPPDFSADESLREFLAPEDLIESDDPLLMTKAVALTDGSADAWEAAQRLGRWVDDEISYDIPGGATALNTFKTQLGECGGHSRLMAAFCRAVGIPCRVVWGCMYVPNNGGSFGQHAWNEVYMGPKNGWVTIDATAQEIDFVDSGHLRVGVASSKAIYLNPKEMEILDFRAGDLTMAQAANPTVPDEYRPYLGEYNGPRGVFKVLVQNGNLAVDIPGKMIFELHDPDANGLWVFRLTDEAGFSFEQDDAGAVVKMILHSRTKLPRAADSEPPADAGVPERFRPYIGRYTIPMQQAHFAVEFLDDGLALGYPGKDPAPLAGPDERGRWVDAINGNEVSFAKDDAENISALILHQLLPLMKVVSTAEN